jgi:long-chain fatty acid transport protein
MSRRAWDGVLRAGTALGLLVIATAQASAGGLAVREQSVYGQGSSFAGIAAGGALSSMFWNPATMTQFSGVVSETDVSGIFPYASNTPTSGLLVGPPFNLGGTSNVGNATLVPAGYTSYQLSPNLWFGVSINAPFGLSENYPDNWAGRFYASGDQLLKTYNATPSLAWQINNWISVGAGVQIQYAKASFQKGLPAPGFPGLGSFASLEGTGWGFGATAGLTLTPTPTTTIGLGWRSGINQKIEGVLATNAGFGAATATTPGSVTTTVDLPDVVSLGIRQRLDPQWTLLGTVEWTNWSRIGTASILQLSGAPATVLGAPVKVAFQWKDGWFFSGGAEYIWSDRLTVRGGLGYEISPVTDQVRTPIVPDNDRFWASVGATWQVIKGVHFDVAYSHIWVKDPNLNLVAGNPTFFTIPGVGGASYVGNVNAHVDVLSAALVIRMDDLEPTLRKPFYK